MRSISKSVFSLASAWPNDLPVFRMRKHRRSGNTVSMMMNRPPPPPRPAVLVVRQSNNPHPDDRVLPEIIYLRYGATRVVDFDSNCGDSLLNQSFNHK